MIGLMSMVAILATTGGTISFFAFPTFLEMGIKSVTNLKQSGFIYPLYMNPPFPSISSYYLFEITNPR